MNKIPSNQPNWYALYTRSRAEKKLHTLLSEKQVESFLPLKKVLQQRSDRKKWVEFPLIPSYLFVRISEKEQFLALNTPGAVCFVSFGSQPVAIPEEQIMYLKNFMVNKPNDVEVIQGSFTKGDLVEVNSGPLKGVNGEVIEIRGKQRLLVQFNSLGYGVHVETSYAELTKKSSEKRYV